MQEGLMPFVNNRRSFRMVTAWPHNQRDPFMVDRNGWFGVAFDNGQQMSATPEIVAFSFDELPWCFSCLRAQFLYCPRIQLSLVMAYAAPPQVSFLSERTA